MTVVRYSAGETWRAGRPDWSVLPAVGWFTGRRFDRHFHDSAEYWVIAGGRARIVVGEDEIDVTAGDLVATPAGTAHDVLAATADLRLFFWTDPVPAGGADGHRHADPADAAGHPISDLPAG
jgi:mannose-6-phosphate isomerase-like protein (cupin superfamily)